MFLPGVHQFNSLLNKVTSWLQINLLSLNVGKTKYFLFKNPREVLVHGKVFMNNQEVLRIGQGQKQLTYKYLGVLIGEDLTFSEHVGRVRGKLISATFMLNQSKHFLPFRSRLQVYRSIFESHLNFATIAWSGNKNLIGKLSSIQNKALKSVFLLPYQSHVTPLLSAHNLMKVEQIITSIRVKFIHNLRLGRLPIEFSGFVIMVNANNKNIRMSRFSTFNYILTTDTSSPKYHIAKSWNSLPFDVKSAQPNNFLSALKQFFNTSNDKPCNIDQCWLCN